MTTDCLTTIDSLLVPPGEVLLEEFLRPMGISQYRLALAIGVPESRINAIVKGRRTITADTDLRLCRFFGLSEGFWLRMQGSHDLKLAKQALDGVLSAIEPIQPGLVSDGRSTALKNREDVGSPPASLLSS